MIAAAEFARMLVKRLQPVLPRGFAVSAAGEVVSLEAPDGTGSSASFAHLDPDDSEPQDYADAAWNVLSMAQDVVSETATDPWPAAIGPGTDLAEPGTRVDGRRVELFFGDEHAPVLRLDPIALDG